MPGLNGIEVTMMICRLAPNCKVIILTQEPDLDLKNAALQAGAVAYVLKTEMSTELIVQVALVTRH